METTNIATNGTTSYQPMGVIFIQTSAFSFAFLAQRVVLLINLLIEVGKRMAREVQHLMRRAQKHSLHTLASGAEQ